MNKRQKKKMKRRLKSVFFCSVLLLGVGYIYYYYKPSSSFELNMSLAKNMMRVPTITEKSVFPDEVYGVPVHTLLVDENTEARTGKKRLIEYIVIHETDNFISGVGAENHAIYLKNNNDTSIAWHYTVDDHEIYHHIPDNEMAYHAGDATGNHHGIGIELCVNSDGNFNKTFDNATKLVAYLLKEYDLTINDIKTHYDFNEKDCPHNILKNNRMGEFKTKVQALLDME